MPIHPVRADLALLTLEVSKSRNRSLKHDLFVRHVFALDLGKRIISPVDAARVETDEILQLIMVPAKAIPAERQSKSRFVRRQACLGNLLLQFQ